LKRNKKSKHLTFQYFFAARLASEAGLDPKLVGSAGFEFVYNKYGSATLSFSCGNMVKF
jgi:hypothetical protein